MAKRRVKRKSKRQQPIPSLWKMPSLAVCLGICVFTFIVLSPSLQNEFVNWDDDMNLTENEWTERLTVANIKTIFSNHVIGNYNPLSILTLAIERHYFGIDDAYPYHLTNLLLHLLCTALVFRWMQLMKANIWVSAIVALLFGIHPMRVESVTWVTERKDVLFGAFYLASLCAYTYYLRKRGKPVRFWYLTIALFVPALLSKIQAVFLPLSMLAVDYYFKRPLRWKLIIEKWPFWLLSLITGLIGIYFLQQQGSLGGGNDSVTFNFGERLLIGIYSLVVYIIKWIYPYRMSPLYPYPSELNWMFYLSPLLILGCLYWTWRMYRRKERAFVFGIFFFIANVFMMLQILGAGQGYLADRFTYIPYIGLFFILGHYGFHWAKSLTPIMQKLAVVLGTVYIGWLSYTTFEQTKVWKDSETLWTHVLDYHDKNVTAWRNRGHHRRDIGQDEKAMQDFERAYSLDPRNASINNSLGKSYFDKALRPDKKTFDPVLVQKAIEYYNTAVENAPNDGSYYSNRGAAYGAIRQYDQAIADLTKAIELKPDHLVAYFNRSILYSQQGKFREALADYNAYLKRNPYNAGMYYQRALAHRQLGNEPAALEDLNRSIQLESTAHAYVERAKVNFTLGNHAAAKSDAQIARQMGAQIPAELQ